jgi:Flp pilus assembly protein TadB
VVAVTAATTLDRLRLRVAAGAAPGDASDLPPRAAAVLRVATDTGAPLLAALDAASAAEDDHRQADRAIAVASSQGRAVAAGLVVAPLLLVPVMARLFDVDLLGYHRTPVGMATGLLGVGLVATGALIARAAIARVGAPARSASLGRRRVLAVVAAGAVALVTHVVVGGVVLVVAFARIRPRPAPPDPRLADAADLTAVAVGGGLPPSAALWAAADEVPQLATPLRRLALDLEHGHVPAPTVPGVDRLADVLTTADAVGAPVGPTLRRLAADVRADELARVLAAAERLPVQLTFPTALCLLPGVLFLVGAPIVASGLAAAGG